ncbi:MAG: hypothetical protein HY221_02590 [Candidatus Sungbacteria bacterium]|uniref:DoxX family protein n=1 Tax=Candidatus Sungiibacteriota bacterium TaxID=2750080 RepID=A0A932QYJ0_9BACT|nr:hypothetical protein [Candidatus Sungbacteria bacterium]
MKTLRRYDTLFVGFMRRWSIPLLRVCLGIVFLWFGALKIFGVSPVADLIRNAYPFTAQHHFLLTLGWWEALIGIGLMCKCALRATLGLLWLQMLGTLAALALAPWLFFAHGNIFLLTVEGEFVVKNFVLIAAGLVIGGYEVAPAGAEE